MRNDEQRTIRILCILGIIPVVWLALLAAPYVSGGLVEILTNLPIVMNTPFHIELCEDSKRMTASIFFVSFIINLHTDFALFVNEKKST